jgi:hypothetical protein
MSQQLIPDADLVAAASRLLGKARPPAGMRRPRVPGLIVPMDGGGSPIPNTFLVRVPIFWDVYIIGWALVADQAGNLTLTIQRVTYDNYPGPPVDTIAPTASPPQLVGQIKNRNPAGQPMTGWTTVLRDGDYLLIGVSGTPTVNAATLALRTREI